MIKLEDSSFSEEKRFSLVTSWMKNDERRRIFYCRREKMKNQFNSGHKNTVCRRKKLIGK